MIKRLARCVREFKWPALISPIAMMGEVYMETRIPMVLAWIVDRGVETWAPWCATEPCWCFTP